MLGLGGVGGCGKPPCFFSVFFFGGGLGGRKRKNGTNLFFFWEEPNTFLGFVFLGHFSFFLFLMNGLGIERRLFFV